MTTPIKRHPSIAILSRDHQMGLMIALVMKKNAPAYRGMPEKEADKIAYLQAQFKTHLKPHFEKEEKILFPFIIGRTTTIDELIAELIKEHTLLEHQIELLSSSVDSVTALDEFGQLLESHIRKEERVLFQEVQIVFSEEELGEIGRLLEGKTG